MSGREWKPGDVAVDGAGNRLMCAERVDGSLVWMNVFGGLYPIDGLIEDARPLVVIDPGEADDTDRIDVDRLDDLLWALEYDHDQSYMERYTIVVAALREFVNPTPPKPDEPTGLGAVVEDARGALWVRWSTGHREGRNWKHHTRSGEYLSWGYIDVVRVLSEGVTP